TETGMRQHPAYDYRIQGRGELVMTEVSRPTATLELPEGFDRALIVMVKRDQVLAELTSDVARRVALQPGEYAVRVWKGGGSYAGRVTLGPAAKRPVAWDELTAVTPPTVAAKGPHAPEEDLQGLSPEAQIEYEARYLQVAERSSRDFEVLRGKYREKLDG